MFDGSDSILEIIYAKNIYNIFQLYKIKKYVRSVIFSCGNSSLCDIFNFFSVPCEIKVNEVVR